MGLYALFGKVRLTHEGFEIGAIMQRDVEKDDVEGEGERGRKKKLKKEASS